MIETPNSVYWCIVSGSERFYVFMLEIFIVYIVSGSERFYVFVCFRLHYLHWQH